MQTLDDFKVEVEKPKKFSWDFPPPEDEIHPQLHKLSCRCFFFFWGGLPIFGGGFLGSTGGC